MLGNNDDGQLGDESCVCETKDLWTTWWGNKTPLFQQTI
jgi:hypothetical protein